VYTPITRSHRGRRVLLEDPAALQLRIITADHQNIVLHQLRSWLLLRQQQFAMVSATNLLIPNEMPV